MSQGTHAVGASGPGKGDPWGQLMLWVRSGLTSHESREGGYLSVCLSVVFLEGLHSPWHTGAFGAPNGDKLPGAPSLPAVRASAPSVPLGARAGRLPAGGQGVGSFWWLAGAVRT